MPSIFLCLQIGRRAFLRRAVVLATLACSACATMPEAPGPAGTTPAAAASAAAPAEDLAPVRPQIYAPFRLTADLSGLTPNERRMLALFIDAAEIMDGLFWQQAYGDRARLLAAWRIRPRSVSRNSTTAPGTGWTTIGHSWRARGQADWALSSIRPT